MPNQNPKDRVSLRLLVSVGSLYEQDNQRGLAHFIEHMAFRGTRRYPKSTLVPTLEKLGMELGPDTAAFTSYNFTVYQLELPNREPATLQLGLNVLREFADNITFPADAIPTERGVVLSEMAARNTSNYRVETFNQAFLWPNSRRSLRSPIGLTAQINRFRREDFQAFYNAWYRPERMAVIVVGDVDLAQTEPLVQSSFRTLTARAPALPEPADLDADHASDSQVTIMTDAGVVGLNVVFEHPFRNPLSSGDTHAQRVKLLRESLAFTILQRRLTALVHSANPAFIEAVARVNSESAAWAVAEISVSTSIGQLKAAVTSTDQEYRRAFLYGFTEQELSEAKANYSSFLQQMVDSAETRSSPQLAGGLANAFLDGAEFSEPKVEKQDLAGALAATTTADCLEAFRTVWTNAPPHVLAIVNPLAAVTPALIAATLKESQAVAVRPEDNQQLKAFPYPDFGPAGRLKHTQTLTDLGATLSEFENGVRLNVKHTDFLANTVYFSVRVGNGKQTMPQKRGLDEFANFGLLGGGLGKCTGDQLQSFLAGHDFGIGFRAEDDAGRFYGACTPKDLHFALQVIAAFLSDPGFRPDQLVSVRGQIDANLSRQLTSSDGIIDAYAEWYMTNSDPRFAPPLASDIKERTYQELSAWLKPELQHGAVEMSLVGDLTPEQATAAAAETVGALPPRLPPDPSRWQPVIFATGPRTHFFLVSSGVKECCVALCWPAPEMLSTPQERRCNLLASLLGQRLQKRIREQLGATYTPSAEFKRDQGMPGKNYFEVKVPVSREHVERVIKIVSNEALALSERSIDPDTFEQARQPVLRRRADQLRQNDYWLYTVLSEVQQYPEHIADARSRAADYPSIGREEIRDLAGLYLRRDNTFIFVTLPAGR